MFRRSIFLIILLLATACTLTRTQETLEPSVEADDTVSQVVTDTPTPTQTPTATPTTTSTPRTAVASLPNCAIRADWPIYAVAGGDTLASIARRVGSSVNELTTANCLADANRIIVGQQLRVPVAIEPVDSGSSGSPSSGTSAGCAYEWFVDLGQSEPCPDTAPQSARAVYQPFEHGFMVWRDGKIWAFYDSGGGIAVLDSYSDGEVLDTQEPPNGLYRPIHGFGKAWVDLELLRTAMGWATAPEEGYTMIFQSAPVSSDSPGGNVLRSSGAHLYTFTLPGNRAMTATIVSTQISSWSQPVAR